MTCVCALRITYCPMFFTHAINGDEDISGVSLNDYSLKISQFQFANDTALITRDYKRVFRKHGSG
eukprot:scaffold84368_cov30-Tisochrysis_lutea.AAC.2